MKFFQPKLASKKRVSLPSQFIGYKINFLWPLQEHVPRLQYIFTKLAVTLSLLCFAATIFAELTFIWEHSYDISAVTECLSTFLVALQYMIRITFLSVRQQEMRQLFERFYSDIFVTSNDDSSLYGRICTITRFISFFTNIYLVPVLLLFINFTIELISLGMASQSKPYIYRMSFAWYDAQAVFPYIFTSIYTCWLVVSCVLLMAAEDYVLCMILMHSSYRYKELQRELRKMLDDTFCKIGSQENDGAGSLHAEFRRRLYNVIRQQQRLDSFVVAAKSHFTYQIFYCITFGVIQLCVVCFQFQRTTIGIGWVKYIGWVISQIAQYIMIGFFGQMLTDETGAMHDGYYMSNWELLLPYGDVNDNKSLMNDIKFAIFRAEHAAVLVGMKVLPLTYSTIGLALRSAVSYYMFLNTVSDIIK